METRPTPGRVVVRPNSLVKPKRCRHCGKRHTMPRHGLVLVHCEGVLSHRARLVLVLVERERPAVAVA